MKAGTPDAEIDAALDHVGVEAPDPKTFIVHLRNPATWFLSAATLWVFAPIPGGVDHRHRCHRGCELRQLGAVHPRHLGSREPNRAQAQPELVGRPAGPGRDPDVVRGDPAQAQLAYEAGELDIVVTPPEDVERVRNNPALGGEYRQTQLARGQLACVQQLPGSQHRVVRSPGPDRKQGTADRANPGDRPEAFVDSTFWAGSAPLPTASSCPGSRATNQI